jgi:Zn-dependent M28 family amino/carboxypeptidase
MTTSCSATAASVLFVLVVSLSGPGAEPVAGAMQGPAPPPATSTSEPAGAPAAPRDLRTGTASPAVPLASLPDIDASKLLPAISTLASDEFEGRLPGTKGEDATIAWLVDQFTRMGLRPGNPDGTFVQPVPLVGATPRVARDLTFTRAGTASPLRWRDDYVAWTPRAVDRIALEASHLVFVGYGIEAPQFDWDDYKGVDVSGKTLVMLVNDPPVPDPANPAQLDPTVFGGRAMTYYGRWTYKYEVGAAKKAAGVLIVHETGPAGYPWGVVKGFADERFALRTPGKGMDRVSVEGWITLETARALFSNAGQDYDALKKLAATRAFKPVPLGTTASLALDVKLRAVDSRNVVARLEGGDPVLRDQYVVYTSHWDHLGVGEPVNGDRIYNGAVDNATGTAGLVEIARAFTKLPAAPRRSVVFLAVTAEEQGLLGSEHYARHPIYPLERTLADINIDAMNVHGRTRDLTVIGYGATDIDAVARDVAAEQGRVVEPEPEPEKGGYYRSDHFPFARQGVPAFYSGGGDQFVDKPADYAKTTRDAYTTVRYHKPQDEVQPDWDLSGMVEDLKLLFGLGYRVAQGDAWPQWTPGNEFKSKRDAMIKQ